MQKNTTETLPADIRLIAAVSRLIDYHQTRRESGGSYAPNVPETAGANLFLALSVIESLHEIEMDRGFGSVPVSELTNRLRQRVPGVTSEDVEFCIANLKQPREIHYRTRDDAGGIVDGRTWDTTPLLESQDGLQQVQLTENARLLLRVTSLRESWLYSDLDADRLVKVIQREQFHDLPRFCRAMTLDVASKSKQLSGAMERPALTELRSLLLREGEGISRSLKEAKDTISTAMSLIYRDDTERAFERWLDTPEGTRMVREGITLDNLQADLQLVLQNVEALSRRFVSFIEQAQRVRNEGAEPLPFLETANRLIFKGSPDEIERVESLFAGFLPWGREHRLFHPSMLIDATDLSASNKDEDAALHTFTLDPDAATPRSRFAEFLSRNRDVIVGRLSAGPASFSEIVTMTGFALEPDDSLLDLFGVYTNPGLLDDEDARIVVGLTDETVSFSTPDYVITGNDPVMHLEKAIDPD